MQILSVRGALPEHRYTQQDITDAFASVIAGGSFDERRLRQALAALAESAPERAGALHRTSVRRQFARHLRHTSVTSTLSDSPAVVDAGIRAAARDQGVFDDLVEIGLGQGLITPRLLGGLTRALVTRPPRPQPSVAP